MAIKAVFIILLMALYVVVCLAVVVAIPAYFYQQGWVVTEGIEWGLFAGLIMLTVGAVVVANLAGAQTYTEPKAAPPPPRPVVIVVKEKVQAATKGGVNVVGASIAVVMIVLVVFLVYTAPPQPIEPAASPSCIRMYQEFRVPLAQKCPQGHDEWSRFVSNHVAAKMRLADPNWTLILKSVLLADCPPTASPSTCKLDVDAFLTVLARYKK